MKDNNYIFDQQKFIMIEWMIDYDLELKKGEMENHEKWNFGP